MSNYSGFTPPFSSNKSKIHSPFLVFMIMKMHEPFNNCNLAQYNNNKDKYVSKMVHVFHLCFL